MVCVRLPSTSVPHPRPVPKNKDHHHKQHEQCLRYVPELRTALNRYVPAGGDQPFLANALKDTLNLLDGCVTT